MSHDSFTASTSDIRTEASAWIAQLETGDLKRADIEAFREWVRRSPRHAVEIQRLARLSAELNVLTDMAGPLQEAAAQYQDVLESKPTRWRTAFPYIASLGVAALLLLLVQLIGALTPVATQEWPMVLATRVGEYREVPLPDGSTLALNTNSQVEVEYTSERRSVRLLQGEVLFKVAKNPQRPFVVFAGMESIKAIGTVFLVRYETDIFEVDVTEGTVRLESLVQATLDSAPATGNDPAVLDNTPGGRVASSTAGRASKSTVLKAGQRFAFSALDAAQIPEPPVIEAITQTDMRRKLAWQEGLLEFSDTPLETVIREVSRHTTLKIEITDPALSKLKFGGIFHTGQTGPLFEALRAAYDIQATYISEDTVQLTLVNSG